jgi:hypothetical protein
MMIFMKAIGLTWEQFVILNWIQYIRQQLPGASLLAWKELRAQHRELKAQNRGLKAQHRGLKAQRRA